MTDAKRFEANDSIYLEAVITALRAELAATKDALDMATQGKYSALMLELADGRAKQLRDAIQVGILGGELSEARAAHAATVDEFKRFRTGQWAQLYQRMEAAEAALLAANEHYSRVRAENDALRDALREIRKAAGSGKEFTNRMQYIHARAGYAIDGLTWTDDHKREYGYTIRDRTMAENDALRKGYAECIEDMTGWAAYASVYFQEKHDLAGNIQRHRAALANRPAEPATETKT